MIAADKVTKCDWALTVPNKLSNLSHTFLQFKLTDNYTLLRKLEFLIVQITINKKWFNDYFILYKLHQIL